LLQPGETGLLGVIGKRIFSPWLRFVTLRRMKTKLPAIVLLFLLFSTAAFPQGSLTPPGAPSSTMKSLDQVEPRLDIQRLNNPLPTDATNHYIISTPGSYYLSANLAVTKTNGIHVTVAGVTIDLRGFEISRSSGSGGSGILIDATAHRCTVRDGSFTGFGNAIQSTARAGAFLHLAASGCTGTSLAAFFTGSNSEVVGCRAHDNAGGGIFGGEGSVIRDSTAANNGSSGIVASSGSTLTNCSALNNGGAAGIDTGNACTLEGCSAINNTALYGIQVGAGSTVSHCVARGNTSSDSESYGIYAATECLIFACAATDNLSSNATPTGSTGGGIRVDSDSTVKDCVAQGNKGDGVKVTGTCLVLQNQCASNGFNAGDGAGIHASGSANRIESNNVVSNDRGIDVDGTSNLIVKNSARNNTSNYEIALNNKVGVIVSAPNSALISGSTGGAGVGSTDPWANISF
jgi:parallel beta-helix repeat protein